MPSRTSYNEKLIPRRRFVFRNINRQGYQKILETGGEKRLRHTYYDGVLEIITPTRMHERLKCILRRLVEALTYELRLPIQSLGSMTMIADEHHGIEPDACYYFMKELDCTDEYWNPINDPPPDLVIEIEASNTLVPRLPIFAKLNIAEVWTFDGKELRFLVLRPDGEYARSENSLAFTFITNQDIAPYLKMVDEPDDNSIVRAFIAWLRTT